MGYAGAFNASRDVINHAAYLADATRTGLGATLSVETLANQLQSGSWQVLDVRDSVETELDFPGAVIHRVRFAELRAQLALGNVSLAKESSIVIVSQNGRRAWQALRILRHHDFAQVYCLSGGARAWSLAMSDTANMSHRV